MSESDAAPPRIRQRQSLSGRLLLVATLAVLLSEIVVFLPYVARERRTWVYDHLENASITMLAAGDQVAGVARQNEMLRLSGAEAIRLTARDGSVYSVGNVAMPTDATIDIRQEGLFGQIRRSLRAILVHDDRLIQVVGNTPFAPHFDIEVWLQERDLSLTLQQFTSDFAIPALLTAGVTGGLVYLAVLLLLVRPMRHITGSIAAFRADPERTRPLDPEDVTLLARDEISIAGQELAAMQQELRAALWRNARLAALGTVVAKVSHDLRGILTPALLTAERLQLNSDPRVQRAGEVLAQAVDRAAELVRRTLDYAREGPPPLEFAPVALAPLLNEAAETLRHPGLRLDNGVDPAVKVLADRTQLFRVLINLLRNAAEAGARKIAVSAHQNSPTLMIDLADDGPGLPEAVRADLFRPFAGSTRRSGAGLGLAIARDLMVAHGGDVELISTGSSGTTFRLMLRAVEQEQPAESTTGSASVAPAGV